MIIVIAKAQLRADARAALLAAVPAQLAQTRAEAGCIEYGAYQSLEDPQAIVFVERWRDRAAVDAHMGTPYTQAFLDLAAGSVLAPPSIEFFDVGAARS